MSVKFDPQAMPIVTVDTHLPAVPESRLQTGYLRSRLAQPGPWKPETTEESLLAVRLDSLRPAAVLVPIVLRGNEPTVLLTQRTAHLHDHAGQISFPGGRVEDNDADAVATALRETGEEIGLHRSCIEIIGELPEYLTGTGYRVMPIVGLITPPFTLTLDAFEVAEAFEVPLAFLMNPANHQSRLVSFDGRERRFYAMPYARDDGARYFIWGATAGMLRNLYHLLAFD